MTALAKHDIAGETQRPAFLGVTRSARGLRWVERLEGADVNRATAIAQRHGLGELVARVLAARGAELERIEDFLNPTLKALLPDPATLRDMDRGAARLAAAIEQGEPLAIFGDYDVDGAASAALLDRFLRAHGLVPQVYIPDRITEGYGPNSDAFAELIGAGARLIVTVDCGTASHEAIAAAATQGADVIVIDHHLADEGLPAAHAVINPNRQDDVSGQGDLAAAGVVFVFLVAVVRALRRAGWYGEGRDEPDLLEWLDLVALATVCDVVPLMGLNRALVAKGLQVMRHRRNAGLRALGDVAGLTAAPNAYHLGFVLGPRINAGGRIGDAGLGARLLATTDDIEAARIAETLDGLNRERKAIEAATLEEAMALADQAVSDAPETPLIAVASPEWHKGLIGLVASRLAERFARPALVVTWQDGAAGTGSARSVAGVDIGTAVRAAEAQGLLVKGGGHKMAAGLTVARDRFEDLRSFLETQLAPSVAAAESERELAIDGALMPAGATPELMAQLDKAGPYGNGNPAPRFAFAAHRCTFAKVVGDAHVRCTLSGGDGGRLQAIAFRSAETEVGRLLLDSGATPLHVAGHLTRNHWGGRETIELVIEDVADPRG